MDKPVQITFRNIEPSAEVEAAIAERASALTAYHPHIIGCRVLVDVPHRHQKHGRHVEIRIELSLPGEDVIVRHEPVPHGAPRAGRGAQPTTEPAPAHQDLLVIIREAFDMARRRLQDAARRQRGAVKTHETPGLT